MWWQETFDSFIIFEQSKGQKVSHKTSIEQMHQNLTAMFLEHTSTNLVKISQLDEKSFFP